MKNKNYEWYSEGAAPYSYGIMNSYYDRSGQLAGQCVTAFKQPPSQAQIQCTEMIVSALNSMYRYPDKYEGVYLAEHILGQGISLEFQDICTFPLHHRQANEAAAYCADCAQAAQDDIILCDFRKAGAASLAGCFDKEYAYAGLHPAVTGIAEFDRDHNTQYLLTLKTFLRNERSYKRTADELFIHKNTVLYRISKTEEMYYIDLSDPDEREYIAASLRLHGMQ